MTLQVEGVVDRDIARAHREAIIEPDRIPDHIRREPVSFEAYPPDRPSLTDGERFALV